MYQIRGGPVGGNTELREEIMVAFGYEVFKAIIYGIVVARACGIREVELIRAQRFSQGSTETWTVFACEVV
jgi:hypothetical protein